MARITVEDCLTKQTNRFALVHLASKRTKQLLQGATVVLDEGCDNKAVVTSLREIAEGKVRFLTEEEAERLKALNLEEQVPGLEPEAIERRAAMQKSFEEEIADLSDGEGVGASGSGTNGTSNGHSVLADDADSDDVESDDDSGDAESEDEATDAEDSDGAESEVEAAAEPAEDSPESEPTDQPDTDSTDTPDGEKEQF
jgi:DNA-directed RNA polymerase subunit omega